MPYEYLDHTADIAIRAVGTTLEQAFSEGAAAMLAAMADLSRVEDRRSFAIRCTAPDIPFLFVEWLNELLYQGQANDVLLKEAHVTHLEHADAGWTLRGTACGEPLDLQRHETYTEVKAATLSGLDYRREGEQHVIQCVLDV
jgi:tRNA nucleotidyltransferase (CCA-adding enzyme)